MNIKVLLRESGKFSKSFSFLIFSSLLVVCFTKSFAQLEQSNTDLSIISTAEEYQQLQEKLHYLASNDEEKRSIAADYLTDFVHYLEVKQAFLEALLTEIDRNPPHIRLMSMMMTAISPFLSSQNTSMLIQLKEQIQSSSIVLSMPPYFLTLIDRAISRNPENISSYTLSDMQDNTDHHTLLTTQLYSLFSKSNSRNFRRPIRMFRRGSVHFLSDHLFFEESRGNQVHQEAVRQVLDTLTTQNNSAPILIGRKDDNRAVINTIAMTEHPSDASGDTRRKTYVIETDPSRINKIERGFADDFSKAKNLKNYLEAVLDIEQRLQVRIVIFMDRFHKLSASQRQVLSSHLRKRNHIKLIAASSTEGYQDMPKDFFSFEEIITNRMSKEDLRHVVETSILPSLRRRRFNFDISGRAVGHIINYVHEHYHNEPLIRVANDLIVDLLVKKSQSASSRQGLEAYGGAVQITDKEVDQFLLELQASHAQQNIACGNSLIK